MYVAQKLKSKDSFAQTISDAKKILPIFEDMMDVLGLRIEKVSDEEKNQIKILIDQRNEFRKQKQFEDADRIRDKLASKGIELKDEAQKTIWLKTEDQH